MAGKESGGGEVSSAGKRGEVGAVSSETRGSAVIAQDGLAPPPISNSPTLGATKHGQRAGSAGEQPATHTGCFGGPEHFSERFLPHPDVHGRTVRQRSQVEGSEATKVRDEIAIASLDQRYAKLRLASPEELERVRASIDRVGMLSPVLVATAIDASEVVLVDGFKRARIAMERGDKTIWVTRSALDATAAKVAMIAANAGHSGMSDLEEAWIVRSLCREHKLTQAEVGKALRRDKSWVCRRLMLAERLEEVLQDDIRLGLLSSTVARELARLPRGNQVPMAAAVRAHGLTSKQAHRVVTELLRTADPAARDEVLANPLRYLGVAELPTARVEDPRLGKRANEVRESLLLVGSASERCARTVVRCAPAGLVGDEARILGPLVERTRRSASETTALLERLAKDSGLS